MFFDKITGVLSQLFFDDDGGSVYQVTFKNFFSSFGIKCLIWWKIALFQKKNICVDQCPL